MNAYGSESTSWPVPKYEAEASDYDGVYRDLEHIPNKHICKDIVRSALEHLDKHPDAALLAYRLLSQRFAISE